MGHGPLCPGRFGTSVDNKELPYKRRDLRTLGLKAISSCMLLTALLRQIITLNTNTYSRCIFFHLQILPLLSILYHNYFTHTCLFHRLYFALANVCLHSQAQFKLCP